MNVTKSDDGLAAKFGTIVCAVRGGTIGVAFSNSSTEVMQKALGVIVDEILAHGLPKANEIRILDAHITNYTKTPTVEQSKLSRRRPGNLFAPSGRILCCDRWFQNYKECGACGVT
jgi:hypothetical protein